MHALHLPLFPNRESGESHEIKAMDIKAMDPKSALLIGLWAGSYLRRHVPPDRMAELIKEWMNSVGDKVAYPMADFSLTHLSANEVESAIRTLLKQ